MNKLNKIITDCNRCWEGEKKKKTIQSVDIETKEDEGDEVVTFSMCQVNTRDQDFPDRENNIRKF